MENEKYIALIISDLNGQINKNDAQELNSWRNSLPENETIYKETKAVWEQTANYKSEIKVDSNKAWENISGEIKVEPKKVSIFSRYSKIAATVLILLTTGFFLNNFLNKTITILTAENETKEIVLPDGSSITLNENSSITYAKNFKKREVELEGEAFFEITKKDGKIFRVLAENTETTVLGTSFNIDANNKNKIELALYTGKVKFLANNKSEILAPGEIVIYDKSESSLIKEKSAIENEIAWKTKLLRFSNTKIQEVVSDIEDAYQVNINIETDKDSNCLFSGKFKDASITEILDAISFSFNSKYTLKDNTYIFEALNCEE